MKMLHFVVMVTIVLVSRSIPALTPMSDENMAEVTGKSLFVTDHIEPNSLPGQSKLGDDTDFDFYRMGLDVDLSLNANIDKLQLGCGGFNNTVASNACDINMDFVRLMGLEEDGQGGYTDNPSPAGPDSDFVLKRPYIELAINEDNNDPTTREVAGIKVGAQKTTGYFGVGRTYDTGETNQEHGTECGTGGPGERLACHSGLSRISGYLNTELSGRFPLDIAGLGDGYACFGLMTGPNAAPECSPSDTNEDWGGHRGPLFVEIVGTRMQEMRETLGLDLNADILGIDLSHAYSTIVQNLRFIHGFALNETKNFGLSFQREGVAYPKYDKSGYSYPSNVGWWMNVPDVAVTNMQGSEVGLDLGEAISALSYPGPEVANSELNTTAPENCFGTAAFC